MSRFPGPSRLLVALFVFAAVQAVGLLTVREASADARGCSIVSGGKAGRNPNDNLPDCLQGGSGCYECAYAHNNQSGYDICAEDTDGSGFEDCTLNVSNFPDWWPDPDPGVAAPEPPPPGDIPDNGTGTGDDGGGVDLGDGGGGGPGGGGPYYYAAYRPPSYLYPVPHHRPYNPHAS